MIDRMTIKCYDEEITEHLTPDFFREIFFAKVIGSNKDVFRLYNPLLYNSNDKNLPYLRITCPHIDYEEHFVPFTIDYSFRQWWFGDIFVKDFSRKDYEAAINLLFCKILELPKKARKSFEVSYIEVGMNIYTALPYSDIKNMIFGFGDNRYSRNFYETGDTFHIDNKDLTFYDKNEQMSKKIEEIKEIKKKLIKDIEEEKLLKIFKGKNLTRIEFKLSKPSTIKEELGFANFEDSVSHFNTLYSYFWKQLQGIHFTDIFTGIPYVEYPIKNRTDFLIHFAEKGMKVSGMEYVNMTIKKMKNRNARRNVRKLLENSSKRTCLYDKYAFMKEIRNNMLLPMYHSGCLNLVQPLFVKNPYFLKKPPA